MEITMKLGMAGGTTFHNDKNTWLILPIFTNVRTKLLSDLPSSQLHSCVRCLFFPFKVLYVLTRGLKFSCSVLVQWRLSGILEVLRTAANFYCKKFKSSKLFGHLRLCQHSGTENWPKKNRGPEVSNFNDLRLPPTPPTQGFAVQSSELLFLTLAQSTAVTGYKGFKVFGN